ncbi:MAG TPA: hypothetical protein VND98_06875 [Solirubrobacterales bacterium]|nr:hypothetical protein [Solirubrobacterales bacterium]
MRDEDTQRAANAAATNARADAAIQRAVLSHLLDRHPVQLTLAELAREVVGSRGEFEDSDALERAVGALIGAGLLHRHGEFVVPNAAALCFDQLGL